MSSTEIPAGQSAAAGASSVRRIERLHVIANPAAGKDEPTLGVFNRAFGGAGIDWDLSITKRAGDAQRIAAAAVKSGVDAVAVYGGDGTVMDAAQGLLGTEVPLAILPGGTANVMAVELGVPPDLPGACAMLAGGNWTVRPVDLGSLGQNYFLVRVSCGLEAAMVEGADRDLKNRLGWLAYALSALQALREPQTARYFLTLDGHQVETEGLSCIVANSGVIGKTSWSMAPNISVSDGLLDVLIVRRADLAAIVAMAASMVAGAPEAEPLLHWQAREINVTAEPEQTVQCDGEMLGHTPVSIKVMAQAVNFIGAPPIIQAAAEPAAAPAA